MWEWHGVDVRVVRAALNPEQLTEFDLPESIDAAKNKDPNYGAWMREYADVTPTELDALLPGDLAQLVKDSVESELDMDMFDERELQEKEDMERLAEVRDRAIDEALKAWREYAA